MPSENVRTLQATFKLARWPQCCGDPVPMSKPLAKNEPARFQCGKCWTEHEAEWTIEKVTTDA